MTILFDENGNALETCVVAVSGFEPETGEFVATYDVRIIAGTGIPGFSTLMVAPAANLNHAAYWNGVEWEQVIDLRGTVAYDKGTGTAVVVKTIGSLSDKLTSIAPETSYDKWDGEKWVTDVVAKKAGDISDAELKRQTLLSDANNITADWRTELTLGIISNSDKEKLVAWMEYIKAVKAVDTSTAPEIDWPIAPNQ
ncbi:tail fiber assembly protein [Cedecea sp. NFIX57]|uniref:tail fiber assembly protein n=1 Tax=Cedecea sp. NFIX57 TaxID=1566286 RepID=UPI000A0DD5B8|nr:tail fiber assembly protein [Cedecea sp. NFIX57]SMG51799.1 virus tail fibre assembly protein, lambda gpK [Cedecea sp. NFIX57]